MFPRLSYVRLRRYRFTGLMICMLITLLGVSMQIRSGYGAVPDLLPLPIEVPLPEQVIFADDFGAAMAIDGDFLAVGAPNTMVNGNAQQGVVYLYQRDISDPTAFTLLKTITGSDSAAHDSFGSSVAIHGETLVVGSHDNAAYVFERNQGGADNWGELKKLVRDDEKELTHFGRSLAIHGDTIVVGAPAGLGEVFIFQRDQEGENQWGKTQMLDTGLPITTSIKTAHFGEVIAFDGETLAISAPGLGLRSGDVPDDAPPIPANFVGAVLVYRQENGQWVPDAKLFSSDIDLEEDPFWDDTFGRSLALNGNTLFISALDGRTNGIASGKVFVYQKGSGTPPPFGVAGEWGEVAQLSPSSGAPGDAFGSTLYAVDDGIFVGAPSQGIGKVYFFRNPAGAQLHSAMAQSMQEWGEVYFFTRHEDGSAGAFGNPLGGSGSSVLIGTRSDSGGSGAIYAFAKEELFAHDPNATATPTETSPAETPTETPTETPIATPTPDEAEPCFPAPQAQLTQLYLPNIVGNAAQTNVAGLIATPNAPTESFTDVLGPGCVLTSPDGVRFAAVQDAITQSIAITIESVAAPPETLPEGSTPLSDFLRISARRNEFTSMENPFVLAIPVPDNADVAHLVIAHLAAPTDFLDGQTAANEWSFIPGVYDAPSGLFLARLPFVRTEGTTLVLLQHPDFASPANQPATGAQAAASDFEGFHAYCIYNTFHNLDDCTEVMEATVEGILDDIYLRMTDSHIFDYPERLRLLDSGSQFIVSETISVTNENLTYAIYLMGPKNNLCKNAAGYYTPSSGFMALCVTPRANIDDDDKEDMIHEFFHAIQYTYPRVYRDLAVWNREEPWIIEGMAEAAVNSYPAIVMQRSTEYGENALKRVDEPLTKGVRNDITVEEYLAQDFWVYVGLHEKQSLGYLGLLLALGGSTTGGMDDALRIVYGKSLSEYYWGWVKHQAVENTYDVGSGPGVPCELTEDALSAGKPVKFPALEHVYPFNTQSPYDRLPPLTAKVIEIEFGQKISAVIGTGYERCDGLVDPLALTSCLAVARSEIKVKVYEEGEHNCHKDDLPGVQGEDKRFLTNISSNLRYFVVVANVDTDEEHGYYITVE